ncbi:hypothetical protein GCM10017673_01090 [Streptosporangium violaceochromogenes]|nr:hypothetical protein GCM10017673_01090 [Streptosporangium violaceochromogenes]
MILISAGLVLTAIVLLIAGFVLAKPFLVMWSIAVSVLSAVFLVIGALLRRHELFPGGGRAGTVPYLPPRAPVPPGPLPRVPLVPNPPLSPAPHTTTPPGARRVATGRPAAAGQVPGAMRGVPDDNAIVLVVPGRRRYHVAGCRGLDGREHEELTREEAREEGFTPCTACLPEFTAAASPQDVSPQARSPQIQSPQAQDSPAPARAGSAATGARETGPGEPTARLASPRDPSADSGPREASVTRPYVQGAAAPSEKGREKARPQEGDRPRREQERPDPEPVAPPLRAAEPFSFPLRFPIPEAGSSPDPNATSWFTREVTSPADEPGTSGEAGKPGTPSKAGKPDKDGKAKTPVAAAGGTGGGPGDPAPSGPEAGSGASGGSAPPTAKASAKSPAKAPARTPPAKTPAKASPAKGKAKGGPSKEAPGGEGEDTDTAPRGIPAVRERPEEAGGEETVKVIVGTRRFHTSACPLIKGVDASGVEAMTSAAAREAGMSSCSVCRDTT